jgi:hypothetical protein
LHHLLTADSAAPRAICHARCARGGAPETFREGKGGEVGFASKIGCT